MGYKIFGKDISPVWKMRVFEDGIEVSISASYTQSEDVHVLTETETVASEKLDCEDPVDALREGVVRAFGRLNVRLLTIERNAKIVQGFFQRAEVGGWLHPDPGTFVGPVSR